MPRRLSPVHVRLSVEQLEDRMLLAVDLLASLSGGFGITPFAGGADASALISALLAPNANLQIVAGSVSYTGVAGQAGTYTKLTSADPATTLPLQLPDGILLTSGNVSNALTSGSSSGANDGLGGDANLTALIGGTSTNDANILTFQFTVPATAKSIQFQFAFGSEEFPVYVGQFNDVMGVFLDGKQIAFDSNGNPLTVNNNFFTLNNTHPTDTTTPATAGKTVVDLAPLGYNGLTPALQTVAPLDPALKVHTLTFAIADAGDSVLDSGAFLANLASSTTTVSQPTTSTADGASDEQIPPPGTPLFAVLAFGAVVGIDVPLTPPQAFPPGFFGSPDGPSTPSPVATPFTYPVTEFHGLPMTGTGGDVFLRGLQDPGVADSDTPPVIPVAPPAMGMPNLDGTLATWNDEQPGLLAADDAGHLIVRDVALRQTAGTARQAAFFAVDEPPVRLTETSARSRRLVVDEGDETVRQSALSAIGLADAAASAGNLVADIPWLRLGVGGAVASGAAGLLTWGYLRHARNVHRRVAVTAGNR